jgi:hypothetical protein
MTHEHRRAEDDSMEDTKKIMRPEFKICVYHIDHATRLDALEKNFDRLLTWVVVGAGSAILSLVGMVFSLLRDK